MNKKQVELLKDRDKSLGTSTIFCVLSIIVGIIICLTFFGIPLGLIMIIYGCYKFNKINKERREIEFKLAG